MLRGREVIKWLLVVGLVLAAVAVSRHWLFGARDNRIAVEAGVQHDLIGRRVVDVDGTDIGDVADVVVSLKTGDIDYVLVDVEPGQIRTMAPRKESLIAIPWSHVEPSANGRAVAIDVPGKIARQAPRLSGIPDTSVMSWDGDVEEYWRRYP